MPRLPVLRQRPGANLPLPPFELAALSREQMLCEVGDEAGIDVQRVGRCAIRLNGNDVQRARVRSGDQVEIGSQVTLLCRERPLRLPGTAGETRAFGRPDEHGIVGESPACWALRSAIRFVGPRAGHVLVRGESGTGKELVAGAVHALSGRAGALIARNAATFPESLIDAELFGNAEGYPNPGMRERKGLVGAADRGTLFLDEFAELPLAQQARLLRVLDAGEYHRLGDATPRRVSLRMIGATNQPDSAFRGDVLARFDLTVRCPDLRERPEDVPFLLQHLLEGLSANDAALRNRVFDAAGRARLAPGLVQSLVREPPAGNVRGLRLALWRAAAEGGEGPLELPPSTPATPPSSPSPPEPSNEAQRLTDALGANGGSLERTWRALGLPSRFALMRMMKKHGVSVKREVEQ